MRLPEEGSQRREDSWVHDSLKLRNSICKLNNVLLFDVVSFLLMPAT